MPTSLLELIRADHADMSIALDLMVSPTTPRELLLDCYDAVRIGFIVHAVAEERVLTTVARHQPIPAITSVVFQSRRDHFEQEAILELFSDFEPGTDSWRECAVELRGDMLGHVQRAEALLPVLEDALTSRLFARLASRYATERMRVLAATLPSEISIASDIRPVG